MKVLLPVDGSAHSLRAAQHLVSLLQGCAQHTVLLLNVQEPIDAPEIRSHMPASEIEAMQESRGGDALAEARAVMERAGIVCTPYVVIGPLAETIAEFALAQGCDKIVMGTRGLGALGGALMGSVATQVLHLTELPVTLVK